MSHPARDAIENGRPRGRTTSDLRRRGCAAAMWCPIGLPEREGPTFAAYDEVIDWDLDGERAHSLVEQAIVRHFF